MVLPLDQDWDEKLKKVYEGGAYDAFMDFSNGHWVASLDIHRGPWYGHILSCLARVLMGPASTQLKSDSVMFAGFISSNAQYTGHSVSDSVSAERRQALMSTENGPPFQDLIKLLDHLGGQRGTTQSCHRFWGCGGLALHSGVFWAVG